MDRQDRSDLDRQFARLEEALPNGLPRFVHWLRRPSSRWVRIPAAILLIAAGFVGFLPILGFWMIPLGLVLIAQDVPFLKPPLARLLAWGLDRWEARKNGKAASPPVGRGSPSGR
jgi:fatty acid desaturase